MPEKDEEDRDRGNVEFLDRMLQAVRADVPDDAAWETARKKLAETITSPHREGLLAAFLRRSRSVQLRWAAPVAGAAVIAVVLLIVLSPWQRSSGVAFAQVAEQLREARTIRFKVTVWPQGRRSETIEIAFKKPGHMRATGGSGNVVISDFVERKSIVLSPYRKIFFERDLSDFPRAEFEQSMRWIEKLQSLPDRADKALGRKKLNGRVVEGFHVTEDLYGTGDDVSLTVWVDVATRRPVQIESTADGSRSIMTGLRFDVDLDDSLFDLTPPEGYERLVARRVPPDLDEEDLIELLHIWGTHSPGGLLPPTLEVDGYAKAAVETGVAERVSDDKAASEAALVQGNRIPRGLMFACVRKVRSDGFYTGEGVVLGAAETPVFWWKPEGAETYRVIYADLSVRDVLPDALPPRETRKQVD